MSTIAGVFGQNSLFEELLSDDIAEDFADTILSQLREPEFQISDPWIQEQISALTNIQIFDDTGRLKIVEQIAVYLGVRHLCINEFPAPQNTTDVREQARPTGETLFNSAPENWVNVFRIVLNKLKQVHTAQTPEAPQVDTSTAPLFPPA